MLIVVTAGVVAFLAVSQLRGPDQFRTQLANETEGDLARILASLSSESTALQEELASLKVQLATIQSSANQQGAESAEVKRQLDSLRVLAGTVPVSGPGIGLEINDPSSEVTYDVLVSAVQELRDAGAEAIAVNGRRVGATSSFTQRDNRIELDGVALPRPFSIQAIGPAATLEGGLKIPGGTLDTLQALPGVTSNVRREENLKLPALANPPSFSASRPVG